MAAATALGLTDDPLPWTLLGGTAAAMAILARRYEVLRATTDELAAQRLAEHRLRRLTGAAAEIISVVRGDRDSVLYCAPGAEVVFPDDGRGALTILRTLAQPDDVRLLVSKLVEVTSHGGTARIECQVSAAAGPRDVACTVSDHTGDPHIGGVVVHAIDVTERIALSKDAGRQAEHDPLTGLLSRQSFVAELDAALSAGLASAVLVVDLDEFSDVNDNLGHATGDRVLTTIAARIATIVRHRDRVARLSGDEFAVLLCDPNGTGAPAVARRLLDILGGPIDTGEDSEVLLTASIGIAHVVPGSDALTVLKHADVAMHEAKQGGGGRATAYAPEFDRRVAQRSLMRAAIDRGLSNREFVLQYQPIHALGSGDLVGFEALLRWRRPDGSYANPAEFLPVAEGSGQIIPLGRWVVHAALRQLGAWRQLDRRLGMAINVSPRQLAQPGFHDEIALLLDTHRIAPAAVTFEVTEAMLVDGPDATMEQMAALRTLGVHLALDDYGAQNAAIGYLLRFPLDAVKLDRSVIVGLDEDPAPTEALIRSITSLAATVGVETVAEGVETAEQLARLGGLGCTKAQGYHLAHPMFPDRAERYLLAYAASPTQLIA